MDCCSFRGKAGQWQLLDNPPLTGQTAVEQGGRVGARGVVDSAGAQHLESVTHSVAHPLAQDPAHVPVEPRATEPAYAWLEAALCDALPVLRRVAGRLCNNPDDVYDLLQDTFERAMTQGMPDQIRSTRGWL